MKIVRVSHFKKDYKSLPQQIQKRVDKQLTLLLTNIRHPSLRVKKIHSYPGVWELRVSREYRLTFQVEEDTFLLRRVGTHDVLGKP